MRPGGVRFLDEAPRHPLSRAGGRSAGRSCRVEASRPHRSVQPDEEGGVEPGFELRGRCGAATGWKAACKRADLIATAVAHRRDRSGIVCIVASPVYTFTGTLDGRRVSVSATFCGGSQRSLGALRTFEALVRAAR